MAKLELSSSNRPVFWEGEVELLLSDKLTIFEGTSKTALLKDGVCYLTNYRLLWVPTSFKESKAVKLEDVFSVESTGGIFGRSNKLNLLLKNSTTIRLELKNKKEQPVWLNSLQESLNSQAWLSLKKKEHTYSFSTRGAGISGLMRQREEKTQKTDKALEEAFSDLKALMSKAGELVGIAKKLQTQVKTDKEENSELSSHLLSMGIASPVTKKSAGALYHTQLAREISDFLLKVLPKAGGLLTLPDVYCILNRARGTALISPGDLYQAANLFDDLKLPVRLKQFESGVLVIQSADLDDSVTSARLKEVVQLRGPQTAFQVSKIQQISLSLAKEQLSVAEEQGFLCRDETLEGVRFYVNFFAEYKPADSL